MLSKISQIQTNKFYVTFLTRGVQNDQTQKNKEFAGDLQELSIGGNGKVLVNTEFYSSRKCKLESQHKNIMYYHMA